VEVAVVEIVRLIQMVVTLVVLVDYMAQVVVEL
jgi:hypothetical protein